MKQRFKRQKLLACMALLLFTTNVRSQMVVNGGFGSADVQPAIGSFRNISNTPSGTTSVVTAWTYDVTLGIVQLHEETHGSMGMPGRGNHIDLNGRQGGATRQTSLTQAVTGLKPGFLHTLTFWTNIHSGLSSTSDTATARVMLTNGTSLVNNTWGQRGNPVRPGWVMKSFTFTPGTSTAALEFRGIFSNNNQGGILIDSVSITTEPCAASILAVDEGCNTYTFSVEMDSVNVSSVIWMFDGDIRDFDEPFELPDGTHELCAYFQGTNKANPDLVCCEMVCMDIEPVQPDTTSDTVSFCAMSPYITNYKFYPWSVNNTAVQYSINGGAASSYNSSTSNNLTAGNYTIRYYDAGGCLVLLHALRVVANTPANQVCDRQFTIPCGFPLPVDINTLQPSDGTGSCICDKNPGDSVIVQVISGPQTLANGRVTMTKRYYNLTQCKICTVTYTVIDQACDFAPDFSFVQPNPLNLRQYRFTRIMPPNACNTQTWTVRNIMGGPTTTSSGPAMPNMPYNYTFPGPGTYEVCMTACICTCPLTPCCKTKCIIIVVP